MPWRFVVEGCVFWYFVVLSNCQYSYPKNPVLVLSGPEAGSCVPAFPLPRDWKPHIPQTEAFPDGRRTAHLRPSHGLGV